MKKNLHYFLAVLLSLITFAGLAQNQVYWREDFSIPAPVTSDPGASSAIYSYPATAGTWTMYGIWTTTGTDCPAAGQSTGTNRHIRSTNNTSLGTATASNDFDDTAFAITPDVNAGIRELHLYRSRNNRRITIWKSSAASVNTTDYTGWTLVSVIPKSTATSTCTDTTILLNDATAKRVMFKFERATNTDIDSVVLTSELALPVRYADASASLTAAGSVNVSWSVATEADIAHYEIQRSADARNFAPLTPVPSKGNSVVLTKYSWIDYTPLTGVNYYRIKATGKDGAANYTAIMKVNTMRSAAELTIAPNPVRGGELNLQLSGVARGNYVLRVLNNLGQVVFTNQLNAEGASLSRSFSLPANLKAGIYTLQLNGENLNLNRRIIIE